MVLYCIMQVGLVVGCNAPCTIVVLPAKVLHLLRSVPMMAAFLSVTYLLEGLIVEIHPFILTIVI